MSMTDEQEKELYEIVEMIIEYQAHMLIYRENTEQYHCARRKLDHARETYFYFKLEQAQRQKETH